MLSKNTLNSLLAIVLASAMLAGCGGGDTKVEASSTTMGQELMDLDESYKKGIITEKEYKNAKEEILDRYN
jgi:hypothetical protein